MINFENGRIAELPKVYLAGGIERAEGWGAGWRSELAPFLMEYGYKVVNPLANQEEETGLTMEELMALKETSIQDFKNTMRTIVEDDLRLLSSCEIVVCKLDSSVLKGAGTYGELTYCVTKGIPVYAWVDLPNGVRDLPGWCIGCLTSYTEEFEDISSMVPTANKLMERKMEKFLESIEP